MSTPLWIGLGAVAYGLVAIPLGMLVGRRLRGKQRRDS